MKPIRIVLADDHTLVRCGLAALLAKIPGVQLVGEVNNGRDALALIEAQQPDVAILDITMPGLNGLEVTARVAEEWPTLRVIILSMHAGEQYVLGALRSGAAAYLVKESAVIELELALNAVLRGEIYLSPVVSKTVILGYLKRTGNDQGPLEFLTPRQREVLQFIAEGHSTKQIAALLGLSVKTVENHRTQLMERLDIHDVASLVRYAVGAGLVDPNR